MTIISETAARITPLFALELIGCPHNPPLAFWRTFLNFIGVMETPAKPTHPAWTYAHDIEAHVLARYHNPPEGLQ